VKSRKRHVVVDILGLVLNCFVGAANQADVKAAAAALVPVLESLADQGYQGDLAEIVKAAYGCLLKLTEKLGARVCRAAVAMGGGANLLMAGKCQTIDYVEITKNYPKTMKESSILP
jgi:hypothetical protein